MLQWRCISAVNGAVVAIVVDVVVGDGGSDVLVGFVVVIIAVVTILITVEDNA